MLVFTAALSLVTPLLFALWPALTAGRTAAADMLPGARTTGHRETARRRNVLVGLQVTLALSLTIVAALVVQSMINLQRIDIGYDAAPAALVASRSAGRALSGRRRARGVHRSRGDGTGRTPGRHRSGADDAPAGDRGRSGAGVLRHEARRRPARASGRGRRASGSRPAFFSTMGITMLAGRPFQSSDRSGSEQVAVLNRLAAEKYFDRLDDAVGRTIVVHDPVARRPAGADRRRRVRHARRAGHAIESADLSRAGAVAGVVGARDSARRRSRRARRRRPGAAAADGSRRCPCRELKGVTAWVDEERASEKIINGLFVAFAVLALALAAAGLFAVVSYSVGQRRREIGIRLALGASPRAIASMVMAGGFRIVAIGMVAGVLLAWLIASATRSLLYGVSPTRSGDVRRRRRGGRARHRRRHLAPRRARDARRPRPHAAGGVATTGAVPSTSSPSRRTPRLRPGRRRAGSRGSRPPRRACRPSCTAPAAPRAT